MIIEAIIVMIIIPSIKIGNNIKSGHVEKKKQIVIVILYNNNGYNNETTKPKNCYYSGE